MKWALNELFLRPISAGLAVYSLSFPLRRSDGGSRCSNTSTGRAKLAGNLSLPAHHFLFHMFVDLLLRTAWATTDAANNRARRRSQSPPRVSVCFLLQKELRSWSPSPLPSQYLMLLKHFSMYLLSLCLHIPSSWGKLDQCSLWPSFYSKQVNF